MQRTLLLIIVVCATLFAQGSWYWPFGSKEDDPSKPLRLHRLLEEANNYIEVAEDEALKGNGDAALENYRLALSELDRVERENPDRAETAEFSPLRNKRAACVAAMDAIRFAQVDDNERAVSVTDTRELQKKWNKKHGIKEGEKGEEVKGEGGKVKGEGLGKASVLLLVGLVGLVGFSHILVWGAVDAARALGVSELLIGLTIIAAGTSLPELASAVVSARKGEHEFVLGNIIGSNIFNTLGVVGLAGTISPFKDVSPYILSRDLPTLVLLSLSIGLFGVNFKKWRQPARIGRWEGALWVIAFAVYLGIMIYQESGMSAR